MPAFGSEWYSRNMYVNGSKENKHSIETYGAGFGYKDLVPMFTAPKFNATEWAGIYARAGARYAGPVAVGLGRNCRFVLPLTHFIPESRTHSAPPFLRRQCDRTVGG